MSSGLTIMLYSKCSGSHSTVHLTKSIFYIVILTNEEILQLSNRLFNRPIQSHSSSLSLQDLHASERDSYRLSQ